MQKAGQKDNCRVFKGLGKPYKIRYLESGLPGPLDFLKSVILLEADLFKK
jgi:hypothetical protein